MEVKTEEEETAEVKTEEEEENCTMFYFEDFKDSTRFMTE